jgi:excinuclease ABC subunit C
MAVQAKDNPRLDYIKGILSIMPECPGVYRYYDKEGTIIYVGKAKNLKRRVTSYFTKEHESPRTARLVRQIWDLKYVVVNTENDALNLENRMIKAHQPKYNVLLKDGKTYPWICVRNEAFPRVFMTRHLVKDGSHYFGPYTNLTVAKVLIELFQQIYKVRTCSLNLQPVMVQNKDYKVCLKYHIKKCLAPCVGGVDEGSYQADIEEIKQILRGHTAELCRQIYDMMMQKAAELKFEEAEQLKEKYALIENYRVRSNIVPASISNVDIFAYDEEEQDVAITYFHLIQGAIIQSYTIEYKKQIDEDRADLLALGIEEMRERFQSAATEIIVPFEPSLMPEGVLVTVPQRGDKRKLLELAEKNLKQYRIDRLKQSEKLNPEQRTTRLLTEIQKQLGLPKLPRHIESFDNSNISGSDPVAACVVFVDGKPEKKSYRKYNIRTVSGPDDYASMHEVVMRRYHRVLEEELPVPDLILADGGVGQMGVILEALNDLKRQYVIANQQGELTDEQLRQYTQKLNIPIGGLVKDNRHRTRQMLFGFPPAAVDVAPGSTLFHLLERIQEEVHRFAITFHRQKRSKHQVQSELDAIRGIGPQTKQALLREFKSVKRLREASESQIAAVVGAAKTKILISYFQTNEPHD